jgi:hypothetical protein
LIGGINDVASWLDYMKEIEVVKTSGAWSTLYTNKKEYKFQGSAGWVKLMEDLETRQFVLEKIKETMIIKFDRKPESIDINPEDLMEVDELKNSSTF